MYYINASSLSGLTSVITNVCIFTIVLPVSLAQCWELCLSDVEASLGTLCDPQVGTVM